MLIKYRFSINGTSVDPFYSGDLRKEYELESGEKFYRAQLSDKLTFIKDDFDWLDAQSFSTQFVLLIEKSNDAGSTWSDYWTGEFYKTDGVWDEDNKKLEVDLSVLDSYSKVLAAIETEYDLVKLQTGKTEVEIQKRPLIQLYAPGDSVVSCFLGGSMWEQDVLIEEDDTSELTGTYHFSLASTVYKINVSGEGTPAGCAGDYVSENSAVLYGKNREYRINKEVFTNGTVAVYYRIYRVSDGVMLFTTPVNPTGSELTFNAVGGSGATGSFNGYIFEIPIYGRVLTDTLDILGVGTSELPTEDLVAYNRNYRRAVGYSVDSITPTADTSTNPTEYGLAEDGTYFQEPYGFPSYPKYYPIAQSTWGLSSIWFNFDTFNWSLDESGRKPYILKDAFPIENVLEVLLGEIDSTITHQGTSAYSEFLYAATNPVTGSAAFKLLITPKSNITAGVYTQPVQKAPITLRVLLSMLRDVYECYWCIDNNMLRIEHISWFKNGGTYTGSPAYAADLTTLSNPKTGKTWGFNSSKYEFDKEELPQQIEFAWMDAVTLAFKGLPIEIVSDFTLDGNSEEINVAEFTSDVDYMLLNPTNINLDGFALLAAQIDDENLFDISDTGVQLAREIDPDTGTTSSRLVRNVTGYIPVSPGMRYSRSHNGNLAFFDASQTYISGIPLSDNTLSFYAPDTAYYIRCDVYTLYWSSFEFIKGFSTDGIYILPYVNRTVEDADLRLQNGYASFVYTQPNFWLHDLPANSVRINDTAYTALGVRRTKKQTVYYPSVDDPDPLELVKTYLGDGQIEKISVNLSSRMNEITLKYDTE